MHAFFIFDLHQVKVDPLAADMYAFGFLLWELWFRALPFSHQSSTMIKAHVSKGRRLPMAKGVTPTCLAPPPKELKELITSCWQQDPGARPTAATAKKRFLAMMPALVEAANNPQTRPSDAPTSLFPQQEGASDGRTESKEAPQDETTEAIDLDSVDVAHSNASAAGTDAAAAAAAAGTDAADTNPAAAAAAAAADDDDDDAAADDDDDAAADDDNDEPSPPVEVTPQTKDSAKAARKAASAQKLAARKAAALAAKAGLVTSPELDGASTQASPVGTDDQGGTTDATATVTATSEGGSSRLSARVASANQERGSGNGDRKSPARSSRSPRKSNGASPPRPRQRVPVPGRGSGAVGGKGAGRGRGRGREAAPGQNLPETKPLSDTAGPSVQL